MQIVLRSQSLHCHEETAGTIIGIIKSKIKKLTGVSIRQDQKTSIHGISSQSDYLTCFVKFLCIISLFYFLFYSFK